MMKKTTRNSRKPQTAKTERPRHARETVRLNSFLAQVGVASRRACDELITAGKVRVDGRGVRSPGARIVPGEVAVTVDGVRVDRPPRPMVLLLNKPAGVVSTAADPEGRTTVIDLCGRYRKGSRLYPVGRLDINTTGALLITNDGLLCYRLTHPRFEVPKTYVVKVRGSFDARKLARLARMARTGHERRGGARLVKELDRFTVLQITLTEGRNRQVRRMCEATGLRVVKLKRVSFGPVSIRKLPLGSVRPLEKKELEQLRSAVVKEYGHT